MLTDSSSLQEELNRQRYTFFWLNKCNPYCDTRKNFTLTDSSSLQEELNRQRYTFFWHNKCNPYCDNRKIFTLTDSSSLQEELNRQRYTFFWLNNCNPTVGYPGCWARYQSSPRYEPHNILRVTSRTATRLILSPD